MAPMPKVLVVDDEGSILASTRLLLADMGYRVATCGVASMIRKAIETEEPDVVLQDVRMPGLDLDAFVADLRRDPRWKELPIVVFSASLEVEEIAERIGARGILDKPFRPGQLRAALESAMAPETTTAASRS